MFSISSLRVYNDVYAMLQVWVLWSLAQDCWAHFHASLSVTAPIHLSEQCTCTWCSTFSKCFKIKTNYEGKWKYILNLITWNTVFYVIFCTRIIDNFFGYNVWAWTKDIVGTQGVSPLYMHTFMFMNKLPETTDLNVKKWHRRQWHRIIEIQTRKNVSASKY